jgi:uncharacterized membrane protein (GlpM family)
MDSIRLNAEKRRSKYFLPLFVGAIWNLVFGSIGLFTLQLSNSLFLNSITSGAKLVAYQIWWFVVLIAGVGYGIVGFKNDKFRLFITFGAIGKIAFFVLVSYLWLNSTATDFAIIVATGDLIWAIYFSILFLRPKNTGFFNS